MIEKKPLIARMGDSLVNLVANLRTDRDKASGNQHVFVPLADVDAQNIYRGSWMGRKIVDIPAADSTRRWRKWQAKKEQIQAIEKEEKRLGLQRKVRRAMVLARLSGGAALFFSDGTSRPDLPIDPASITKGGIKYVTVVKKVDLTVGEIETDINEERYGLPKWYKIGSPEVVIHPSRLVIFTGAEVPDDTQANTQQGWGDSILQSVKEAVTDCDATMANIASLIFEAKIDVISIPDFMSNIGTPEYEAQLRSRLTLAGTAKGINGMLILDAAEKYDTKSANFSTLPDIVDRFLQAVCGAADIPATRLIGMSPAGLNSTGEADLRNYYDRIQSHQTLEVTPALAILDECLLRSALGSRDESIYYEWQSLWQTTEKERADIGKIKAETLKIIADMGVVPGDAMGETVVNTMTESNVLPGLEAAVAKYGLKDPDDEDGTENDGPGEGDALDDAPTARRASNVVPIRRTAGRRRIADAEPLPLYVRRDVVNADEIRAWANSQGFAEVADDLHVTIAYSRQPVDWMAMGSDWMASEKDGRMTIGPGGPRMLDQFGKFAVLLFASSALQWRHDEMKEKGASWDHPEYNPHISIAINATGVDLDAVVPYKGRIVLGPEIFEALDEDHKATAS